MTDAEALTKIRAIQEEIDRWMREDPYGFQETMWEIAKAIGEFAAKTDGGFSETNPVGQTHYLWLALCAYVQKQLDVMLLSLASDAWGAGKATLTGRELHQAHGLLSAIFSTMAVAGRMRELEAWTTSVVATTTSTYEGLSSPSRETFFLAILESGAIKEARRASGVLRAVATASDAKMIALAQVISKHPHRVTPAF